MPPSPTPPPAADELYNRLARFVRGRVSDPADAEDVLHEILAKLVASQGPSEADKLVPWAFVVARNAVTDFYRKRSRDSVRVSDADVEGDTLGEADRPDLQGALRELMLQLSEEDQHALRTVDLEGTPQKTYAEQLGIDYPAAKSRVQRARKRLRREFDRCCHIALDARGSPLTCQPRDNRDCC